MLTRPIIGADIGRSATKVVCFADGLFHKLIFPSIVSPAFAIADERTAKKAELETVEVNGKSYFVGDTARLQGGVSSSVGLSHDWVEQPEYLALVKSIMKRLDQMSIRGLNDPFMVIGTPAALYNTQKKSLECRTNEVVSGSFKVLPQPMGAYCDFTMDAHGKWIPDRMKDESGRKRSWAVVEVGHYTTDFLLMREGEYIERCAGSCEGINFAAEHLVRILGSEKIQTSLLAAEQAIQTGKINHFGMRDVQKQVDEAAEHVVGKILAKADSLLSNEVATLDGVLLAGGGAPLVAKRLQEKWPHTIVLEDSRMAVADGFCRFGIGVNKAREVRRSAENKDA